MADNPPVPKVQVLEEERRQRIHEFFKEDPAIWEDIMEEVKLRWHNESRMLKGRQKDGRDWSAGYVTALEEFIDMKRYFVKSWKNQTMQGQQKVLAS